MDQCIWEQILYFQKVFLAITVIDLGFCVGDSQLRRRGADIQRGCFFLVFFVNILDPGEGDLTPAKLTEAATENLDPPL